MIKYSDRITGPFYRFKNGEFGVSTYEECLIYPLCDSLCVCLSIYMCLVSIYVFCIVSLMTNTRKTLFDEDGVTRRPLCVIVSIRTQVPRTLSHQL